MNDDYREELEAAGVPLTPGSVIQMDALVMRTRFDNWVSDGGFITTNEDLAYDLARGFEFGVIFDAALLAAHPATAIDRIALAVWLYENSDVSTPIVDEATETSRPRPWGWLGDESHAYYLAKADALLASGVLGIPADHPVPETLATYTVTRTPITAGAKTAAGYEPVAFEYQAKSGTDAIAQAVKDCEWRDPRQNFSWRVTSRKVAEQ